MIKTHKLSTFPIKHDATGPDFPEIKRPSAKEVESVKGYQRMDTHFMSKGVRCAAWLYLPDHEKNPPVVIMAHGLGGERKFRLDAYAERFVQRKMACFVFDYRGFGDSEGEPRQNINPYRHLEDWDAAIAHVRNLEAVDTGRIALWGTSFSAGHVIVMAARNKDIRAIVGQVPFVDGVSSSMNYSLFYSLRAFFHGMMDLAFCTFSLGKIRHRVKYATEPGTFGVLNTPDALSGVKKLLPKDISWEQADFKCPASIFITLPTYRPIRYAKKVRCPALIIYSESDSLIPASAVRKAISKMPNGKGLPLPLHVGHFDPYVGKEFESVSAVQADFFESCFGMISDDSD
ncbi:MAG: alpha/beta fold hydrolase [Proteobacteria bacterium]|nr:alpha/beta fold hydrolase [Pseudomonadota bacterium]